MPEREKPSRYDGSTNTSKALYTAGMSLRPRPARDPRPLHRGRLPCRGRSGPPRRNGRDQPALEPPARAPGSPSPRPAVPTPPTTTSPSVMPHSARTFARASGSGPKAVKSVPFPTTRARHCGTHRASVERSSAFWYSSACDAWAAIASMPSTNARRAKRIVVLGPETMAGVDDDRHADRAPEQSSEHAGLGIVGVQHVEVERTQRRGQFSRGCYVTHGIPRAGERWKGHVPHGERLDVGDVVIRCAQGEGLDARGHVDPKFGRQELGLAEPDRCQVGDSQRSPPGATEERDVNHAAPPASPWPPAAHRHARGRGLHSALPRRMPPGRCVGPAPGAVCMGSTPGALRPSSPVLALRNLERSAGSM